MLQRLLQQQRSLRTLQNTPFYAFSKDSHFNRKKEIEDKQAQDHAYRFPHPVWKAEELTSVEITHQKAYNIGDKIAYAFIQSLRMGFDVMSGYKAIFPWQTKDVSEKKWIDRVIFLETVAGVPGFAAGMHRHLRSLRYMERDHSWIHTLVEEAENERVHLLTFLHVKQPTNLFKSGVVLAQFWYVALFFSLYGFFPRVCHRMVGYLEEEAVKTYTHCLKEIEREGSPIHHWKTQKAPGVAIDYWCMDPNSTMYDVVLNVRADEAHHRDVNHTFGNDYTQQRENPFNPGDHYQK